MTESNTVSIPLFPLNLVLYPGMVQALHIFEPRYKAMVNRCLDDRQPFGIILIADGTPEGGPTAKPFTVGTTARIVQVQRMEEGRMNIWTVGETRFNILDYSQTDEGYLLGEVEMLDDPAPDPLLLQTEMAQASDLFDTYIKLLVAMNDQDADDIEYALSKDPDVLSYQIAAVLDITSAEKQTLLEMDSVETRLTRELAVLEREIELLQQMVSTPGARTQDLPWGGEVHLN